MNITELLLIKLSNCGQKPHLASDILFKTKVLIISSPLVSQLPRQAWVPAGRGVLTNSFIMNGWLDWIIRKQTNSLLPVSNNNNNKYHSTPPPPPPPDSGKNLHGRCLINIVKSSLAVIHPGAPL